MTVTYNSATINARLNDVITQIDAGAGPGLMRMLGAFSTTVCTLPLVKPSGTVAAGVLTFSGLPLAAPLTQVTAQVVAADIEDSNGTVVVSGLTVGPSTSYDVFMANPFVSSGQTVSVTFATITGR